MPKQIPIGPSWTEVILGALLSFLLGVALAAGSLVMKPVTIVTELPKEEERKSDAVYYIEGSRDATKGRLAAAKRAQFAQGGSVTVNEAEINLLIPNAAPAASPATPPPPAAKAKAGEKEKGKEEEPETTPLFPSVEASVEPLNFRVNQGLVQMSVPVKLNVAGIESTVFIRALGKFVRGGGQVVFAPESVWAGSLPLDRLPMVDSYVYQKFIGSQPVPPDIAASWARLAGVLIDRDQIKLTMP